MVMQKQPTHTGRPTYSLVDIIRELMGFEGSMVVMSRVFAEDIVSELNRLYDIEDGCRCAEEQDDTKTTTQP